MRYEMKYDVLAPELLILWKLYRFYKDRKWKIKK